MTEEEIMTPGAKSQMAAAFNGQFGSLIGSASGYVASLPANVRRRLDALKNLQLKNQEIEIEFHKEVLELEKKYLQRHDVLYSKRETIINGKYEPTDQECMVEEDDELPPAPDANPNIKGIPEFWATALKNLPPLAESITEEDDGALKYLTDIKYRLLDGNPGFALDFYFAENEYFTNSVLTKTYFLEYSPDTAEEIYDRAEGTVIDWKEGKDLSVKVEIKKQRHKASNKTRTVKKTVPAETFFSFFSPLQPPNSQEEEEHLEEEDFQAFEMDYDVGEMIKERLIPNALNWFNGSALAEFQDAEEDDFDEYEEDDDDDDDDDDVDAGAGAVDKAPECKQQ